jgi:hypothetical protein
MNSRRFMQSIPYRINARPIWANRQSITPGDAGLLPISGSPSARNPGQLRRCCDARAASEMGHEQPRHFGAVEEAMPPKAAATAGGRGFREGPRD